MVRRVRYPLLSRLFIFHSRIFLASNDVAKVDHVLARDVRQASSSPTLREVIFQQALVVAPTEFSLFCVAFEVFFLEIGERYLCAFLRALFRGIGSMRDGPFGIKGFSAGIENFEIRILAESYAPRSTLDSASQMKLLTPLAVTRRANPLS